MSYTKSQEKYLITGACGQLGNALQLAWGGVEGAAMPRAHEALDIADHSKVLDWMPSLRPDAIVNCAAYTNVGKSETDAVECWRANVLGVDNLARTCAKHEIPLLHVSTDFVFGQDGISCPSELHKLKADDDDDDDDEQPSRPTSRNVAYTEDCPPGPVGHYSVTKLAAEHVLLNHATENPDFMYWIIRTAGMFESPWRHSTNFPFTIASKLLKGEAVNVVTDVHTNVCYVDDLVPVVRWIIANRTEWSKKIGPLIPKGIYHIANRNSATWYDIASRIAIRLGCSGMVRGITRTEYARRFGKDLRTLPSYTCMNLSKYHETSGPPMPYWEDAIDRWCDLAKEYF